MNKISKLFLQVFLASILLAACGATPAAEPVSLTITMESNVCTYSGPTTIPAGAEIAATWIVKDQGQKAYSLIAFTLLPGKTLEDAKLVTSAFDVTGILETAGSADALGGTSAQFSVRTTKGPIYFTCFSANEPSAFIGPIAVDGTN